jgi:hypothetical protein
MRSRWMRRYCPPDQLAPVGLPGHQPRSYLAWIFALARDDT